MILAWRRLLYNNVYSRETATLIAAAISAGNRVARVPTEIDAMADAVQPVVEHRQKTNRVGDQIASSSPIRGAKSSGIAASGSTESAA